MHANTQDFTGKQFHRLKVLSQAPNKNGRVAWHCKCACGKKLIIAARDLPRIKSCGCYRREWSKTIFLKHGETAGSNNQKRTAEYRTWRESFLNFLEDMGRRPGPQFSIDRYPNNKGNYEPGNCRWATMKQQSNNRTRTSGWKCKPRLRKVA